MKAVLSLLAVLALATSAYAACTTSCNPLGTTTLTNPGQCLRAGGYSCWPSAQAVVNDPIIQWGIGCNAVDPAFTTSVPLSSITATTRTCNLDNNCVQVGSSFCLSLPVAGAQANWGMRLVSNSTTCPTYAKNQVWSAFGTADLPAGCIPRPPTLVTQQSSPSITLVSSKPTGAFVNENVTYSGVVSFPYSQTNVVTGAVISSGVIFPNGTVTISIDGFANTYPATVDSNTGAYSVTVPADKDITKGTKKVTASFAPDNVVGKFLDGTTKAFSIFVPASTSIDQLFNPVQPVISVVPSHASLEIGKATISFTITLSSAFNPSGAVTYSLDGGAATSIVLNPVDLTKLTLNVPFPGLAVGTHTLTVNFAADGRNNAAVGSGNTEIVKAPSTITVYSSNPSAPVGTPITFTGTVSGYYPTGTVSLTINGQTFTTTLNGTFSYSIDVGVLPAGSFPVTVSYGGDDNNFGSSTTISQDQKQIITKVNPSITIDDTPDPSVVGQTVTFSGLVTGVARLIPTGTVTLTIGSISSGPITLTAQGGFAFTTSALAVGQDAYFADYSGDDNYNTLVAAQSHTTNRAPSTTTVSSSVNPSASGADVTFSGTVTGFGTPSGSVTLTVNNQVFTLPLTNGEYSSAPISLHTGSYPVNVHYNGDDNNLESSAGLTQTVNTAAPTLTIEVNPNPSVVGTSVTYSGSVQGDAASGSILITVRGITFSATLDASSNYRYTTSAGDAGTFPVSASYAGDANNGPASASASQTVNKVPTTVSIVSSKNPSVSSEAITFSGVVSAEGYIPTGSVTLTFNHAGAVVASLNAQGQYSVAVSDLVAGSGPYAVDVAYGGDKNSLASANEMTQVVQKAATIITLIDNPAPSSAGQTVVLSGSVSGDRPSGNVVLSFLGKSVTVALDSTSQFSTSYPFVSAGSFPVSAHYHGDGNNEPADASLTHTVIKVPTTTTIGSSVSSSTVGDSVTFSGTVTNGLTNVPVTGSIVLTIDGVQAATILVNPAGGYSYTTSDLKVGTFQVSAAYSGDNNNLASGASLSQTVAKATPLLSLFSSLNPSVYGDNVQFGGIVAGVTPTGFVTVKVDGTVLGVVALDSSGLYAVSTSTLEVGTHAVTADYSGDSQNNPLSASLSQVVDKAPTTTVADTNVDPVGAGNPFTIFGTVTGKGPTGSVSIELDGVTSVATLTDGSYVLPVPSGLPAGTYTITVQYPGDSHNLPSTGTATVGVVADPSSLSLESSRNPSPVGTTVTFSGAVLDGLHPTGSVTLTIDGTLIATVTLDSASQYTYSTDKLSTGTHLVVADYLGDVNNQPSSASLQQKVDPVPTIVSIQSSSNPSQAGETVTFTGTVTLGFQPTGNVQIDIDGLYYLIAIDSSYSYSFTSAPLTAGDHSVSVTYLGDTNNLPSSNLLTQSVNKAPTTISEASSQNPAEVGTSVTVSGSVNGGFNPTGTVTITLDGATYTVPLVNGGYSFPLPPSIAVGDHVVAVEYSGDSNNLPSANFITQTISSVASSITLVSSLNPSTVSNEVVFSGSVTGYHVSGTITLEIGEDSYSVPLNNGQYQYSTSSLSAGDYVVVATYPGDANNKASTAQLTQTVRPGPSTITIESSKNPAVAGDAITFSGVVSGYYPTGTVTVTIAGIPQTIAISNSGYSLPFPSGFDAGSIAVDVKYNGDANNLPSVSELIQIVNTAATTVTVVSSENPSIVGNAVTFSGVVTGYGNVDGPLTLSVGGTPISLTVQGGFYTYTTATLSVGSSPVVAQYLGNNNNAPASAALTQEVQPAPTTVTVSSSKNPSIAGEDVTFSGSVSGYSPSGLVVLSVGSTNVSLTLTDGGTFTYTTSGGLDAGSIPVKAYYLGDAQNLPSQDSLVQTVSKDDSSITISSSKNPSIIGDSVTFSGAIDGDSPTGFVGIYINDVKAAEVPVGADFSYTFTTARLPVGEHIVEARYLGDNNNDPETASLTQVVKQAPSTTTIVPSANPSPAGQTVTFSGTVTGFNPTGSVVLTYLDQTVSVALSNGAYSFTTDALNAGTFLVTASYGGDVNNAPSGAQVYETVQPVPTQITITSDKPSAIAGETVTFSGQVTGGVGIGGENITLTIDGVSYPVTLGSDGSYSFTAPNLPAGTKSVHVEYPGNPNSQPSDATLQQPVVPANTVTTITSSLNPATVGDSVTFSGAVTGGSSPTGTVTIYIDGTPTAPIPIGSDGSYSYPTSGLPPGTHNITAVYSGDGNNNPSSATITQNVLKGSPSITVTSSLNPAPRPSVITFSGVVSGGFNPTGTVTLTVGSLTATVALVGNAYTYTTASNLAPGTYSVVATYDGDANNNVATASLTQVVNKADVSITLASSLNPSVYQNTVTFSGVVAGFSPSGTVALSFSSGLSATVTLDANSAYTYTTSALPVGVITVTANYNGDSNNGVATTSITQTVTATQSALTLASSKNPSTFQDSVTFSGTVTGISPTGTVQLYDDGVAMGSPITLVNAAYSFTTSTLTVGNHNISAAYSGDLVNKQDYASLVQTVRVAPTTVTIVTSPNPSDAGQAFVASGAVSGATPTGSVVLSWTGSSATVTLSAGSYTYSFPNGLPAGSYPFTVTYNGDANNGPCTASLVHQVNKVATTTVVTTSASPVVVGTAVTFSGSVQGGYQVSGTITLTIGSSSVTLNLGAGATFSYTPATPLVAGTYTVTASYPGDQNNKPSSGSTTQVVNLSAVTITVVSSLNPSTYGQAVAFSGVVTGYNPTGTVTLFDGATILASGLPLDAQKKYTFQTNTLLSVGTHAIKAVYSGDSNNQGAQATLSQVVNKAPTTTTIASSANPSVYGQSLTFSGTVSAAVGVPSGTVTLSAPGLSTPLTATLSNGAYSFTGLSLPLGTTAVSVAYGGDSNYLTSSASLNQVVNKDPTVTTIQAQNNPAVYGEAVTISGQVSATAPGQGTPTGSVTIKEGTVVVGTVTLNGGSYSLSNVKLPVGVHTLVAYYGADSNFLASQSLPYNLTINKAPTTTTLAISSNTCQNGGTITLTGKVTAVAPGAGLPSGTVTIYDNGVAIGTATVTASTGAFTFTPSSPAQGSHSYYAFYNGDANFLTSQSPPVSLAVGSATTTVTIVSSVNPSFFKQSTTFSGRVTASNGVIPTGSVTLTYGSGTAIGTATLSNGAYSLAFANLPLGSSTVRVTFAATQTLGGSTATVTQVVKAIPTTTAVVSSANPSSFGQSVVFTATVTASVQFAGVPSGTVSLYDGATLISGAVALVNGVATFPAVSSLAVGSHALTASYIASVNSFLGSTGTLTQTVRPAATTTTIVSSPNPSQFTQSVTLTVTVAAVSPATGTPSPTVTIYDYYTVPSSWLVYEGTGPQNNTNSTLRSNVGLTNGRYTFSTSGFAIGTHRLVAVYPGSSTYLGSFGTTTHIVVCKPGVACADGNLCTTSDTCQLVGSTPVCKPGSNRTCSATPVEHGEHDSTYSPWSGGEEYRFKYHNDGWHQGDYNDDEHDRDTTESQEKYYWGQCHYGQCNPLTGKCDDYVRLPNGTACDTGYSNVHSGVCEWDDDYEGGKGKGARCVGKRCKPKCSQKNFCLTPSSSKWLCLNQYDLTYWTQSIAYEHNSCNAKNPIHPILIRTPTTSTKVGPCTKVDVTSGSPSCGASDCQVQGSGDYTTLCVLAQPGRTYYFDLNVTAGGATYTTPGKIFVPSSGLSSCRSYSHSSPTTCGKTSFNFFAAEHHDPATYKYPDQELEAVVHHERTAAPVDDSEEQNPMVWVGAGVAGSIVAAALFVVARRRRAAEEASV